MGDGGGDHSFDVETNHTVIYAVGSTGQLLKLVASVGISNEQCNDRAQNVGNVPTRRKHPEKPTANLAGSGHAHT